MPSIFSMMFSVACALSLFLGIYTLYLNAQSKTNILFFILTVTLDIWAFGFSMAVSADDLAAVLFWRRFSAIGWGAFFSVLLHFFSEFTKNDVIKKKGLFYIVVYLPVVITYLGFTYLPGINPEQYNMELTSLGWINVAVNNAWDWFYTIYYVVYSMAGFYLVWQWGRQSKYARIKKQSRLILVSFLFTIILGSLTDILGNLLFSERIPQLAPLLMILPSFVVYYSIKKYGLLNPLHIGEDTIMLSDQIRTKIINYMSNAFLFGGIINLISQYLLYNDANFVSVLAFSGGLILVGVIFQAIQRSKLSKNMKDVLIAVTISLVIPIIIFKFIDFAGVTIWAFPFILLIITLVFGKSYIQISLSISIVMTLIIVWMIKPEVTMTIDAVDHVARLGMFLIAIWCAHFIKNIYQSKLRENAEQINSQKIITEISTAFISASEGNLDEKVQLSLDNIGAFTKCGRLYVYLFDESKNVLTRRYFWSENDGKKNSELAAVLDSSSFPQIISYLKNGNQLAISDLSDMTDETGDELVTLLKDQAKSLIVMPIVIKDSVYGIFGMDIDRKTKRWHETHLGFFKIITNILADAFEKVENEQEIAQMAFYDYLTKLPNRNFFKDSAAKSIQYAERANKIVAVLFLDLDAFKAVNDTIGHDGGDNLIYKVSEKLAKTIRKTDVISRFGGDEFLIMLDNLTSPDEIGRIVEKILCIFDLPFIINEQEFYVTASVGIAVYPNDGTDPELLIKNADIAMYKAKELGKNQYLFCTSEMKEAITQKLQLTNSLYKALERHEFLLHYQPQVITATQKVIGAEALIRWIHPERGLISPGLFIPLAEQTGLIGPIGDWVLRTACLQCKSWQLNGLPDIRIAVNVSVLQLRNPYFVFRVQQILEEVRLEPRYLELEVTESTAVTESDYIFDVLNKLKDLGVSISIDDFGTEYSSLSRLTSMPVDRIKLDMQFVHAIGRGDKDKAIIRGIIGLAHNLGMKVVAEGVETDMQLDFLSEKQCDEIQGFYFYRPVAADDLESILTKMRSLE